MNSHMTICVCKLGLKNRVFMTTWKKIAVKLLVITITYQHHVAYYVLGSSFPLLTSLTRFAHSVGQISESFIVHQFVYIIFVVLDIFC